MVSRPEDHRWSSYAQRLGRSEEFVWLDTEPCFEGLGDTPEVRPTRYTDFVRSAIPPGEWEMNRSALQRGQLTGNERFVDEVEAIIGRRIEHRQQGRPRMESEKSNLSPYSFIWGVRGCKGPGCDAVPGILAWKVAHGTRPDPIPVPTRRELTLSPYKIH